ncbi:hypothetical protein D3C87_1847090 [compost metagenome]
MQAIGRAVAGADRPQVEPCRVADDPFGIVHDNRFIARELRQVRGRATGFLRKGQTLAGSHQGAERRRSDQETASIHSLSSLGRNASRIPLSTPSSAV